MEGGVKSKAAAGALSPRGSQPYVLPPTHTPAQLHQLTPTHTLRELESYCCGQLLRLPPSYCCRQRSSWSIHECMRDVPVPVTALEWASSARDPLPNLALRTTLPFQHISYSDAHRATALSCASSSSSTFSFKRSHTSTVTSLDVAMRCKAPNFMSASSSNTPCC